MLQINTPFILAPPLAAKAFYASVSGSLQLPAPHDNFYIFPCLNPPLADFEFDSWRFPAMQGGKGARWLGMPGGRFSLGRYKEGSGYCVGAIVQTLMGVKHGGANEGEGKKVRRIGELAGNGMRDVWVIGEGFFRGVGGVFDVSLSISLPHCECSVHDVLRSDPTAHRGTVPRAQGWLSYLLSVWRLQPHLYCHEPIEIYECEALRYNG